MKRLGTCLLPLALVTLAGCGIQGKWSLESVEPASAAKYSFAKLALNEDGTFSAEAEEGSEMTSAKGQYEFADGKLTFTFEDGEARTYDAKLLCPGTKMRMKCTSKEGEEITALWKRE